MPALRKPYEFDVFFSYPWATSTGNPELREWSRKLIGNITTLLSQRFGDEGARFHSYLDRDQTKSGQDIENELKGAAERSGLFVAVVSNFYNAPNCYCPKELDWFCDKLAKDGLALADHVCILRAQTVPNEKWPSQLKASNGNPLAYIDLCTPRGQTIDMAHFLANGTFPTMADKIDAAALEIGDKLVAIKNKQDARQEYLKSQFLPELPLLFFEAETQDRDRWIEYGARLNQVPSIVLPPDGHPKPATAVASVDEYDGCNWFLMLRSRVDDDFGRRLRRAHLDLRKIAREKKQDVRWAFLDALDEPPPEGKTFRIPRVPLQGDWLPVLLKTLSS